jgi:5-methylcytosine-specific restriction endonuclease McrA
VRENSERTNKNRPRAFRDMVPQLPALYDARRQRAERLHHWLRELTRREDASAWGLSGTRPNWRRKHSMESHSSNVCKACYRWHVKRACVVPPKRVKRLISPSVRFYVYDRDDYTCRYCGIAADLNADWLEPLAITIDHVIPWQRKPSQDPWDLVTACWACNYKKRDDVWVPGPRPHALLQEVLDNRRR